MPGQSRASSESTTTPAPEVAGPLPARGGIGNAARLERLLAGKAATGESRLSEFSEMFPDLDGGGSGEAGAGLLMRVAEDGQATDEPAGGDGIAAVDALSADAGPRPPPPIDAGNTNGLASPATGTTTTTTTTTTTGGNTPATVLPKAGTQAAGIYAKHQAAVGGLTSKLTPAQVEDLAAFKANWAKNKARYEAVSQKTGVPAALIAALHWRESTGNFKTYLHQGDPLGKPARHVPKNIPVFHVWEDAAVHALTMSDKAQVRDDLGMTANTRDGASMATYAEFYNGLGYHNKGRPSPYVYSGTDKYQSGKYIRDGVYSKSAKDQQLGVLAMVGSIGGMDQSIKAAPARGPTGWDSVLAGRTIQRGAKGPIVKTLQAKLASAGHPCGDDGKFGPSVETAVKAFQLAQKIEPDGIVGADLARRLDAALAPKPQPAPGPGPVPTPVVDPGAQPGPTPPKP